MLQHSKQRMAADNQFLKLQTRALSRNRMASDIDTIVQKRTENTARLRSLRLAKEQQDRTVAASLPSRKNTPSKGRK